MTKTLWTKDFIRITLATSLGAAGGIISGFALSFLVFDETGSTLASALVVAIQLLPGAVLPLLIAPLATGVVWPPRGYRSRGSLWWRPSSRETAGIKPLPN